VLTVQPRAFQIDEPQPIAMNTITLVEALTSDGADWSAIDIGGLPPADAVLLLRRCLQVVTEAAEA
jgi:hypothetical protein